MLNLKSHRSCSPPPRVGPPQTLLSISNTDPVGRASGYTFDAPLNYDMIQQWMRENGAYRSNGNCLSAAATDTNSIYESISCPPGTFLKASALPLPLRRWSKS